jgi:hypothetical protein
MKKGSNISKISKDGNQDDEFIVKLDFYYCDVTYEGFLILNRREIFELLEALYGERELYTPNMPGDWCEEFSISLLKDAFTIHSSDKEDITAMRSVFGDRVGNIELYDQIVEGEDEEDQDTTGGLVAVIVAVIDREVAQRFMKDEGSIDLSAASSIDEAAAVILSKFEGCLFLDGLTELSDVAAEALSKHKGDLGLNGLTELSNAAAEALSKHEGWLCLDGLTELSDVAAEALSKHEGDLALEGLTELSDVAAEALSKHKGCLYLYGLTELSDTAAEALAKHEGEIGSMNPAEWVASLREE